MAPRSLLLLVYTGILATFPAAAGQGTGLCYASVNKETGECAAYLGEGASQASCCLNNNYGFKKDINSPCEACQWVPVWSEWSKWSPCTVSCTEGVQKRSRVCIGQGSCGGENLEVQVCSLQDCCPQAGGWSEWSAWSSCSVTCATGSRKRIRLCNNPPPTCGGSCPGQPEETETCDTKQICPTHGQWGNWGSWGQCSSSCVLEGSSQFPTQLRSRLCNNPPPSSDPPGNPCQGGERESQECRSVPICPVDGQWGAWQKVSACSVQCGVGQVSEKRSCDNPAPRHAGRYCVGSPSRVIICDTGKPCKVDGLWSEWGQWTKCKTIDDKEEVSCEDVVANQFRRRRCLIKDPEGQWCPGDLQETRRCYNVDRCTYRGTWTEWGSWGLCSSPCGYSERKRYRECVPKYKDYLTRAAQSGIAIWGNPRFNCAQLNGESQKLEDTKECKNTPPCT